MSAVMTVELAMCGENSEKGGGSDICHGLSQLAAMFLRVVLMKKQGMEE